MADLPDYVLKHYESRANRYPEKSAMLIPLLKLVQDQQGYISQTQEEELAKLLEISAVQVHGVTTFYSMLREKPSGKHHVRICRNVSCQLRGAGTLIKHAEKKLGISVGETTENGNITLETEECLASCGTAPALWCDGHYYENLDIQTLDELLDSLE